MRSDVERLTAAWDALLLTLGGPPLDASAIAGRDESKNAPRIPVSVFSGFLGAGKTTLLCQLLQRSSIEVAAIVNDIGSINVDAALIRSQNAETIEFQNGCACCVLGDDLRETLEEIGTRSRPPEAIVIEASGISDPMGIAQSVANVETMTLDGIVTVVDARSCRERSTDAVLAPLFERQLAAAHLIVLTKTVDCDDVVALREFLGKLAPGCPVVVSDQLFKDDETGVDMLLGAAARGARPAPGVANHRYDGIAVETVEFAGPICERLFCALLDELPDAVYRVKGWMWLQEFEPVPGPIDRFDVQAAGTRWRIVAQTRWRIVAQTRWRMVARNGSDQRSQLVVIGRAGERGFTRFIKALKGLDSGNGPV